MMVNTNAWERMAQLCHEDALENYIDLCEKTIDKLLDNDVCDSAEETIDYVKAYRGLIREFTGILEEVRKEDAQ